MMSIMRKSSTGTQSLERSCELLRQIASYGTTGATLSRLARQLDLPHPTVHRILGGLVRTRLAHFDPATKLYRIGPFAFELGLVAVSPLARLSAIRPIIANVAELTGDTAYLMALQDDEIVCLINREGGHQIRANIIVEGARRPMCDSVAGLALLASMDDREASIVLERSRKLPQVSTRLEPAEVMQKIVETRDRGLAYWSGVVIPGVAGAAVAVSAPGHPHLAIALSTITARLPEERLTAIRPVLEAAAERVAAVLHDP
jgi:DNA-binding IclR family transcriptional regulator